MRPNLRTLTLASVVALTALLGTETPQAKAQLVVATPRVSVGIGAPVVGAYPAYGVLPPVVYSPVVRPVPVVRPYPYVVARPRIYGPRPYYRHGGYYHHGGHRRW
jgi:hypothetical protein